MFLLALYFRYQLVYIPTLTYLLYYRPWDNRRVVGKYSF